MGPETAVSCWPANSGLATFEGKKKIKIAMELRRRSTQEPVKRAWQRYSFREPENEDQSSSSCDEKPAASRARGSAKSGLNDQENLKWSVVGQKEAGLFSAIKQAVGIAPSDEKFIDISDNCLKCLVVTDQSNLFMISQRGRVLIMTMDDATASGIHMHPDRLVFPGGEFRNGIFQHLEKYPSRHQGFKMPFAVNFLVGKNLKSAEGWHFKRNELYWPLDSNIWIEKIEPGALLLTNVSGQVEIAFKLQQKDIIPLGESQEYRMETETYSWQMYACEFEKNTLKHELMDTPYLGIPGMTTLKDAVCYNVDHLEMLEETYSPEVAEVAFQRDVWHSFTKTTVFGSKVELRIGMGIETIDGALGVILAMDSVKRDITQIKILRKDFPETIIRKTLPWQVFATDQIRNLSAEDSFNTKINLVFEVLPVAFASVLDKLGNGNRFVIGHISGESYPFTVKGVSAPSIERILAMSIFLGSARLSPADRYRFTADFQHQIDTFIQSKAVDDSQSVHGQAGVKSNSVEIRCIPLSFLSHVMSMKGDEKYSASCDAQKGINVRFERPNILCSLSGMQALLCITDRGSEAVSFRFCLDKTAETQAQIRFEGPISFKVQFHPYEIAAVTVSGWSHVNEISSVSMAGTDTIPESTRNRELNAAPESILKTRSKRPLVCTDCFPAPCNC